MCVMREFLFLKYYFPYEAFTLFLNSVDLNIRNPSIDFT